MSNSNFQQADKESNSQIHSYMAECSRERISILQELKELSRLRFHNDKRKSNKKSRDSHFFRFLSVYHSLSTRSFPRNPAKRTVFCQRKILP